MPFFVSTLAAMPPECPEPTMRTSYSFVATELNLENYLRELPTIYRIDRIPHQTAAAAATSGTGARGGEFGRVAGCHGDILTHGEEVSTLAAMPPEGPE